MPDFSADWPDGIFQAILTAIDKDRWRYAMVQPREKRPPVPTAEQLRQLLEVASLASLEKEEGRPADFSLVFATPAQADPIPFALSEPLTAELVRRLMPMADSEVLGLAVRGDGDSLSVWGLAPRREDAVVVRVVSPGRLALSFGGATLARFQGNRCTTLATRTDEVLQRIGTYLSGADDVLDIVRTEFLWALMVTLRSFGHGGTVVVLGDGKVRGVQSGREFAPPMRDLSLKVEMARAALQREADAIPGESPRSLMEGVSALRDLQTGGLPTGEIGAVLKTIARFTQVDGALLLDSRFQALRVGAKLSNRGQVRAWFLWRVESDSNDEILVQGIDGDFAGTRHSSALRFVSRNPGCLAFTCSQDGSLTLFVGRRGEPPKVLVGLESLLS